MTVGNCRHPPDYCQVRIGTDPEENPHEPEPPHEDLPEEHLPLLPEAAHLPDRGRAGRPLRFRGVCRRGRNPPGAAGTHAGGRTAAELPRGGTRAGSTGHWHRSPDRALRQGCRRGCRRIATAGLLLRWRLPPAYPDAQGTARTARRLTVRIAGAAGLVPA